MENAVRMLPRNDPTIADAQPPLRVIPTAPPAVITRANVSAACPVQDVCRNCRRKMGNRPKTSMENSIKLNTCVVDGRREASTVDAITAALVEREAGNLVAPAPSPLP